MLSELIPGSVITKIPINPTKTANHLNNPTFSFNKKIEKIAVSYTHLTLPTTPYV